MQCPWCGFVFADAATAQCPRCGSALRTPPPATSPSADWPSGEQTPSPSYGSSPAYGSSPSYGSSPAYGSSPSYGSGPGYSGYPTAYPGQPTPPGYSAPPSAPLPSGSYAPPSAPLAPGYYGPPSMPLSQNPYGPPSMPLGYPPYGAPGGPSYAPPPPPPPRRRGPVIAIVSSILVVVALIVAGGAALVLSHQPSGASGTPGAQTSYNATVSPGSTASATATPNVNVIFHDDFSSSSSGWTNDSHCYYGADGYHIPDGYICYAPAGEVGDAIVSADMKQTAGETNWFYGIVFRRVSKGNFYEMNIDSNGKWLFDKVVNDQTVELMPYVHSDAIHTGLNASNHLEARAVGTHFEFYINGVNVGHFDDSTYAKGLCGVEGGNPEGQVQVVFTQFMLALPN